MMIPMVRPHAVFLIGAIGLAVGWLAGTTTSPATQEAPAAARRPRGARALGAPETSAAPYAAPLRRKLDDSPRSPMPGRNPFVFGSRRPAASAPLSRSEEQIAAFEERVMPTAPPPFQRFRLSGIAASEKDGSVVLTAIVIDNGSMTFAQAGDKLSGGHSVLRVEERSIVIVDASGVEQTLRLP